VLLSKNDSCGTTSKPLGYLIYIFDIFLCFLIQVSKDIRYADYQPIVPWGPRYFPFQFIVTEPIFHI
jgi:hypothetical protein